MRESNPSHNFNAINTETVFLLICIIFRLKRERRKFEGFEKSSKDL